MSGELVSLKMVAISALPAATDLWRQGAGLSPVPVEFSAFKASTGAAFLVERGADICLIDSELPAPETAAVIAAARSRQPRPLIFISGPANCARPDGVDGMLARPIDNNDARNLIEVCVRATFPTRVLIVDDSSTMRSIVRKILSSSRFRLDIHEAVEGFAALQQLRGGKFGMVFLDYNMPGLNGIETLSEIKRETPGVAVVIMTSTVDNAVADRARAEGALAFLKKPFYPADIDSVLERFYGLRAAR